MPEEKSPVSRLRENPVVYGTLGAIATSLIGTFLLSIVFYYSPLSESYLKPAGTILYLICAFLGGFLASKKAGNRGIMYGSIVGLSYFLIILLIFLVASPALLSVSALFLKGVYTLIVAAVGGVIGIAFTE